MNHIVAFAVMGMIAACIAGFWTRIIRKDMIFNFVHIFLTRIDQKHVLDTGFGSDAPLSTFLRCIFCVTPWLVFILDACYIILDHPAWYFCTIGVFASLGAGNFISETIYALRGQE